MLNPQVNRRPVSMMRRAALAVVLLAVALPIAAASQAVSTPSGTVIDPSGRPLGDAVLRLNCDDEHRSGLRNAIGRQRQRSSSPPCLPGDYMLRREIPGFLGIASAPAVCAPARVHDYAEGASRHVAGDHLRRGGGSDSKDGARYEAVCGRACFADLLRLRSGQLTPPMKIRDVRPRYKQAWIDAGLEGNILMQARIGTDGRVRSVDALSPVNAELEDEAIAAVSQWQFSPTYPELRAGRSADVRDRVVQDRTLMRPQ